MPPTPASRTVNGDPIAPVNPPGSHPITAPINEPTMPMTILSGDASAIRFPGRIGNVYSGSVWFRYGLSMKIGTATGPEGFKAILPRSRKGGARPPSRFVVWVMTEGRNGQAGFAPGRSSG